LFEQPLRQLRDVFGVLNQVANLNSVHTNSVFGLTRLRPAPNALGGAGKLWKYFIRIMRGNKPTRRSRSVHSRKLSVLPPTAQADLTVLYQIPSSRVRLSQSSLP